MLNHKLKAIADLVNPTDIVLDIGTDHAYLAIYLKKEHLAQKVYASDISENVLKIANKNIKANKVNIPTFLSNGFENIKQEDINTAIISGMGTSTILSIIKNAPTTITKYIISSNNNHEELRKNMLKYGFYVQKEIVIKEKEKYYPIMLFQKNIQKETKQTLKYGKSNNQEYFNYLLNKEQTILKKIPRKSLLLRIKHLITIKQIKKILKQTDN